MALTQKNYAFDYSVSMRGAFNELGYPNASDFNSGAPTPSALH